MSDYTLRVTLLSDTTFGRGDGVVGVVDEEVEHDGDGFPIISGRRLKGLLVESCAEIVFNLDAQFPVLDQTAQFLFGVAGTDYASTARLKVGTAQLDNHLRGEIKALSPYAHERMTAFTAIRRQTAMDITTDTAERNSLRASRVVLRHTIFTAPLDVSEALNPLQVALLAASTAGVQRGGIGRNRGRGRLAVMLYSGQGVLIAPQTLAQILTQGSAS